MSKEGHAVRVVRITEILKHPNADKLEIYKIPGTSYQSLGPIGQFKSGDLGIYICPDSVVPQTNPFKFIWEGRQEEPDGTVREKYRRIKARKLRGEWSEGLLLPVTDFPDESWGWQEGDDVAEELGITHYEPVEDAEYTGSKPGSKQTKGWPRSLKGWGFLLARLFTFGLYDPNGATGGSNEKAPADYRPIYDVENFKHFPNVFQDGEIVYITEKIHGSNARFTYVPSKYGLGEGKLYVGSRKLWKSKSSKCIWREGLKQNPWIEEFCRRNPNYTLYAEIVPTQELKYGCKPGEIKVFVFDIRTSEGEWIDAKDLIVATPNLVGQRYALINMAEKLNWVPILYVGPFTKSILPEMTDGHSEVAGSTHIREGCVIRPENERDSGLRGLGRAQLKLVSNKYLEGAE